MDIQDYPYRISGPGIYNQNQPRYRTAEEAYYDLESYAHSVGQSWLLFTVYKDLDNGDFHIA